MAPSENNRNPLNLNLQRALIAFSVLGSVLVLGWLLNYSAYGIDFTDESFYLVWISNPFIYSGSATQFGFIYHPLFSLLGGDIAALRQANILITYGLAWSLVYFFLTSLGPGFKEDRYTLLATSAGLAISVFTLFDSLLITPSYNSLTLQALLVCAIGLILSEKVVHRKSIIGWILIGVGGWLAFMAKPTTAIALAFSAFIYLLLSRKLSIRMLALSVATVTALLLISALLIDGSILRFIERFQFGLELSEQLGGGYTMELLLRIDRFLLNERIKIAFIWVFSALLIAFLSICTENKKWSIISHLISFTFFLFTASLTLGKIPGSAGFGEYQGLLVFALVFAVASAGLLLTRFKALVSISLSQWAIAILFGATPHIYAFGTNLNYWQAGGAAAIFWLLAGLVLIGPLIRERTSWLPLLPLAFATQAVTATLLQTGFEQPYRQPQPLRLNTSPLEIGSQKSTLILSQDYADYIASAISTAREAAFEPDTPMIDLSGRSPGILYSLGAQSIGQGWTIGGYPGSLKLAETALAHTACEKISTAWVLFEEDGPRSIPTELMLNLGAVFPDNYMLVGFWNTAESAGGDVSSRRQELYKPVMPSETLKACMSLRKEREL